MGLAGLLRAAAAAGRGGRGLARAALDTQVPRDVVLFRHDRARFFHFVALLCVGQGLFWAWLARLAYVGMRPPRPAPEPEVAPAPPPGRDQPFTSSLWRYGFSGSCLAVGCLVVGGGLLFSRRCVRQVVLHRGGRAVTLRTHSPFGLRDSVTVPLQDVSCRVHRSQVPTALPIKVRGITFYFLLDRAGQFLNPQLFDLTVGAYRKL